MTDKRNAKQCPRLTHELSFLSSRLSRKLLQEGTCEPAAMIMVLRRWFIPSDKLEEFRERWRIEIKPELQRQPGCIRIEIYESSIRGHWVTSVLWQDEDSRMRALQQLSGLYNAFRQYERFEAEVLTLRAEQ